MKNTQATWQWEAGAVDENTEHIELSYGAAGKHPYESWTPIARLAKPNGHVFTVEWLLKPDAPRYEPMLTATRHDLDFYLVEKAEPNPWAYALYHCNTGVNMYSAVHWSYFPNGRAGKRRASTVIKLSAAE